MGDGHGHGRGGKVSKDSIFVELEILRKFLKKPRYIEEIMEYFGWSEKTTFRRLTKVRDAWRVSRLSKNKRWRYVVLKNMQDRTKEEL